MRAEGIKVSTLGLATYVIIMLSVRFSKGLMRQQAQQVHCQLRLHQLSFVLLMYFLKGIDSPFTLSSYLRVSGDFCNFIV